MENNEVITANSEGMQETVTATVEKRERVKREPKPKATPHLKKLDAAESKLPELSETMKSVLRSVLFEPVTDVNALISHLKFVVHKQGVVSAHESNSVAVGDHVTFVSGDPKWIGVTGIVSEKRRIRCFVAVEGRQQPIYCFVSDVKKIDE